MIDSQKARALRADFPLLCQTGTDGQPVAYLDSGATTQKPLAVLERMDRFYRKENAAVHRGTHHFGDLATMAFESGRETIANFFGISDSQELCFTSGATMALNEIAYAFINASAGMGANQTGKHPEQSQLFSLGPGDKIVTTVAEHHANLLPWQQVTHRTGSVLSWLNLDDQGRIRTDKDNLDVIDSNTRVLALTQMSNVSGAITDLEPIIARAKQVGALVVLDTCQSACHMPLDISEELAPMGVDFAVFSAHKLYGPTGVGALWGREELLAHMPPFISGGSMVGQVTMDAADFMPLPAKLEAGTQPVAQIVGWAAACEYLNELGMDQIMEREKELVAYALEHLTQLPGVRLLGPDTDYSRGGVFSFQVEGVHPHDVGQFLDSKGLALRVGHHCAQPIHQHFGVKSSTRATLSITSTEDEIDALAQGLGQVREFFQIV